MIFNIKYVLIFYNFNEFTKLFESFSSIFELLMFGYWI